MSRAALTQKERHDRSLANKPDVQRTCESCASSFTTKNPAARVCSISCRNRLNGRTANDNRAYPERPCDFCHKPFVPKAKHGKYCSRSCIFKARYYRNIEYYRARDKVKIRKNTIGLNIRDEHLQTPTRNAKWLWDGIGAWSVKYPDVTECLECNTHVYRHAGNGVCAYCTDKLRSKDEENLKALKAKHYEKRKAAGSKTSASQAKEWIAKAKERQIPITPKIGNLLENLEMLEANPPR